jgi:hypothetical protein
MPLNPLIKAEHFNIKPDGQLQNYRLCNFRVSDTMGWICRIEDPHATMILSATIEEVLVKMIDREYPVGHANLNFALAKIGAPPHRVKQIEHNKSWVDTMEDIVKGMTKFLPNMKLELCAKGVDFMVLRINSKKQAKKILKSQIFRDYGKKIDRNGAMIAIMKG